MGRPPGPTAKTQEFVRTCREILAQIQPATVRGVAYQCFTRDFIASMERNETSRVSDILIRARERGEIPWPWIVSEHQKREHVSQWDDPVAFLRTVRHSYRKNLWQLQPRRVEIWSEKGTVKGVLRPLKENYGVDIQIFGGWGGGTDVYNAAQAIASDPRPFHALYVGDLDPSGAFMSDEDLPRRLDRYGAGVVEIHRIAIIPGQTHDLPSFSAEKKRKDTRYRWFVQKYGRRCYELDAMDPRTLRRLVDAQVEDLIDPEAWSRGLRAEEAETASIQRYLDSWPVNRKGTR